MRAALPADDVVRLACAPTHGFTAVSEFTTSTRSSGTPSVSGHDHASHRLAALPDLGGASEQRDLAEVVHLHDGAAAVRR